MESKWVDDLILRICRRLTLTLAALHERGHFCEGVYWELWEQWFEVKASHSKTLNLSQPHQWTVAAWERFWPVSRQPVREE